MAKQNIDPKTVTSFGEEWGQYHQGELQEHELEEYFDNYFHLFPWSVLPAKAQGFDMGCGSGRWAKLVAPKVHHLHCIDASPEALNVARKNLAERNNVSFHHSSVDGGALEDISQDFGYSLGVLHHIPDTEQALASCTRMLKPGAPFLLYLYYRFDQRSIAYKALWKISESARGIISRLPNRIKPLVTDFIALTVYWPMARLAKLSQKLGLNAQQMPLYAYRYSSLYTMRTDSRDRFGTPLEQRFLKSEIEAMMQRCGLGEIQFSDREPYWVALGIKQPDQPAA